ncbi:nitroreductase family protein [Paraburkholderia tropica]|uniref:nitroreductase family protein n=1 Tax=Paraburkholderia tropica TaxID=92647 RepID=UPI002AAFB86F|nr:nitroreductase family protein [Paraburkholderia tropica]
MSNETIRLLQSHRSERDFTNEPVSDEILNAIVRAAQQSPTHRHGQQISLVVVRDAHTRQRLFEVTAGPQPQIARAPVFILVAVDFHKTSVAVRHGGGEQHIHESLEGWTVGAVDAGITLATLSTAARSFGLGAVAIGAIRHDPQPVIDLLGLPRWTFPIVGICIGYVVEPSEVKPRLPVSTYRHDERYDAQALTSQILEEYDRTLLAHWAAVGRKEGTSWTQRVQPYRTSVHPETRLVAERQGFTLAE